MPARAVSLAFSWHGNVVDGSDVREPVASLPGTSRLSRDRIVTQFQPAMPHETRYLSPGWSHCVSDLLKPLYLHALSESLATRERSTVHGGQPL